MNIQTRKSVIIAGAAILTVLMTLGSAASFVVFEKGFSDLPGALQISLSGFGAVVLQGAYLWLVYGYTRAFSDGPTRLACFLGMLTLLVAEFLNLVTSLMLLVGLPLHPFQEEVWLPYAGVIVFVGLLVTVLIVTFAEPVVISARRVRSYARR